jgi:hypothetical protein
MMLRSASHLQRYRLLGSDGDLGSVGDFLFDDRLWVVRYVAVDTGKWLPGRLVLISPAAVDSPDWESRSLTVALTKEQVESSPSIAEDQPVSRQREIELHAHYGWAPYWMAGPDAAAMTAMDSSRRGDVVVDTAGDPHLRSSNEVTGYHIEAKDGDIGHVEDFILEDETWTFRYLVVDTKNWWPGKKVLVAPSWIEDIRWGDRKVAIDLTRERIRQGPEYDPSAPVNREYETRLYDFHGRPYYWR